VFMGEKVKLSNLGDGVGTDSGRLTGGMLVDGWTSCWVVVSFMVVMCVIPRIHAHIRFCPFLLFVSFWQLVGSPTPRESNTPTMFFLRFYTKLSVQNAYHHLLDIIFLMMMKNPPTSLFLGFCLLFTVWFHDWTMILL
jgi:hypothetical protein